MLYTIFLALLALVGLFISLFALREVWRYFHYPAIQGPNPIPIIGKFEFLDFNIHYQTQGTLENMRKYPRMYMTKDLALVSYFVHDLGLIKEMTVKYKEEFADHPEFFFDSPVITSRGLVSLKGHEWRSRRKLVGPHFHGTKLHGLIGPIFMKQTKILVEKVKELPVGEPIDVLQMMRDFNMDVIGEFAFGVDFGSQEKSRVDFSKAIADFIETQVQITHLFAFPFWHHLPFENVKAFLDAQQTLLVLAQRIIDMRKANNPSKEIFYYLDSLIFNDLSCRDILGEAVITFLAGSETSAITLMWALYHILKDPVILQRVQAEIREHLGDEGVNDSNIFKLKYLECVMKETLRFYPPNAVTTRENDRPLVLDGVHFPARTFFFVPIWALHHSEEYFDRPDEFDPSRFEGEGLSQRSQEAYIPFGFGERVCLGRKFAILEAKAVLASLIQNFEFDLSGLPTAGPKWNMNSSMVVPESLFVMKKV